jgi:hypothetical protein
MVSRNQLNHAIRTACQLTGQDGVIIIGSQSILASFDVEELPSVTTGSREVDILAVGRSHAETTEYAVLISGVAGELSPYDDTHDFYLDGVDESTAVLPQGWRERLVRVENEGTVDIVTGKQYVGLCLEPHDLCVAKLCALREKDQRFVEALIGAGLVASALIAERLETVGDEHEAAKAAAVGWLSAFLRRQG